MKIYNQADFIKLPAGTLATRSTTSANDPADKDFGCDCMSESGITFLVWEKSDLQYLRILIEKVEKLTPMSLASVPCSGDCDVIAEVDKIEEIN